MILNVIKLAFFRRMQLKHTSNVVYPIYTRLLRFTTITHRNGILHYTGFSSHTHHSMKMQLRILGYSVQRARCIFVYYVNKPIRVSKLAHIFFRSISQRVQRFRLSLLLESKFKYLYPIDSILIVAFLHRTEKAKQLIEQILVVSRNELHSAAAFKISDNVRIFSL